ncbi:NADP-dependent oxidoreductase [Actinoallomurus purpureus]|uniref:NADP-dependent oxidoreductase n=1 Tax=Actinoallomurus purpureus TaxID=478114 RepID=UPI00209361DD|nr:NADP-dependent oxidoreductase [Actinoallomurus purpureus]MCO6005014.1 NADP-dependent oxidoreductase [Actinoallomurus purpureus]
MKAITMQRYGGPEVLELTDVPEPRVGPDSVLVRAKAAGVNPVDWKIREGYLDSLFPTHFPVIPGWDLAGVVERVGPAVSEFSPGDEVIGYVREDHVERGTYAELVSAPVRTLGRKPRNLSWAEAAGLPLAGLTAYQALTKALTITPDDTVLIHAASGGVGTFAVQIARAKGARVIGTASPHNHDHLRELGAEPVAYGPGLTDAVRRLAPGGVSAALDLVGGEAVDVTPDLLTAKGRWASIVDPSVIDRGGRYVFVRPDPTDLAALAGLVDDGRLTVALAKIVPLADAAEAQRLNAEGHTRGKIVLEIA